MCLYAALLNCRSSQRAAVAARQAEDVVGERARCSWGCCASLLDACAVLVMPLC